MNTPDSLKLSVSEDNYRSISLQFRIGCSTVGTILREVFNGINDALEEEYGQVRASK